MPAFYRSAALYGILVAMTGSSLLQSAHAQIGSVPGPSHYVGVERLYEGDYRDAYRTFLREVRTGGVQIGVQTKWVDSICYHAMLGETLYQWGRLPEALEQFDAACGLYLQYPNWLLRVNFDQSLPRQVGVAQRRGAPWGMPTRQSVRADYSESMLVAIGQIDNSQAIRGGVVQGPQYWRADVVEILRCLALSMRRRNELLGPLGEHNDLSKDLAAELARGGARPNHWSNAWLDVLRGVAHAGVGETQRALQFLNRGLLVSGRLDHPLTCVALLEQGLVLTSTGNADGAARLFVEAGLSAFEFEDRGVIDDAFRWSEAIRLAQGNQGVNPVLQTASAWARGRRLNHLFVQINLAWSDELMQQGDWSSAATTLEAAKARLNDARTGLLGVRAAYLEAKLAHHLGANNAPTMLGTAIEGQQRISTWNFQIAMANAMFDDQRLLSRHAAATYAELLRDPNELDVALRLADALAVMKTPHDPAFSRWMTALLERRDSETAFEVADLEKRRRYHQALPWGGRLAAIRDAALIPDKNLSPDQRQAQMQLRTRFPQLADAVAREEETRAQLNEDWGPAADVETEKQLGRKWKDYAESVEQREAWLKQVCLRRIPAEFAFPPVMNADRLASTLASGQAVLAYHDTSGGLLGFLYTSQGCVAWNCGAASQLQRRFVEPFLRALGNTDANREMTVETLTSEDWKQAAASLYEAVLGDAQVNLQALEELIVVPDGPLWYVPFEALHPATDETQSPLISTAKVRYAPTAGLAFSSVGARRRVRRSGVLIGELAPGDDHKLRREAAAGLKSALPGPMPIESPLPTSPTLTASLLDQLVVLADVPTDDGPLDWPPIPLERRASDGSIGGWLAMAGRGPQRVFLPGMHTPAERGGMTSRRRGGGAPGSELFFAACSMMSAGAETIMFSRWSVGGHTALELVRELVVELPHTPAGEAWQRAVHIASATPIDPLSESRVEATDELVELTAAHPFFWAGYLVIDSGWSPPPIEAAAPAALIDAQTPVAAEPSPPAGVDGGDVAAPVTKPQAEGNGGEDG
ncbi:MAG: CHAT domain-containing protein [Planctomycetota bacterium]